MSALGDLALGNVGVSFPEVAGILVRLYSGVGGLSGRCGGSVLGQRRAG